MATRWNDKASNKVKQVCETTGKNSNVKKQHKTPSLEQQATKLSKQEKHYKKKPPRQKPTTKQNDKKKFGPSICLPYLYSWSVETTPIHTQQLHIATTNLNLIFFVFPNLKPSLIGLTKQHEPRALLLRIGIGYVLIPEKIFIF